MADLQQFATIISGMLDVENEKRQEAEKQYEAIESSSQKLGLLFQLFSDRSTREDVRSIALVLTRRLLSYNFDEIWAALGTNQENYVKQLVQTLLEESNLSLQKKMGDVLAEIASNMIDEESGEQKCREVIQFLEHCFMADNVNLKQIAMSLLESVPNIFGSEQDKHLGGIKQMFESGLQHENSGVRTATAKAFSAFMTENDEDDKAIKQLSPVIAHLIKVCEFAVTSEDCDDVPIQCLSDLSTVLPKSLSPYLDRVFQFSLQTIVNESADDAFRHSSMELLTSLCESAPNMVKKRAAQHIPALVNSCLTLMFELDDDTADWLSLDDAEDGIDEDTPSVGETSLDRIACALGGKVILQPFLEALKVLLHDSDWKKRHAGLFGVSTIGEGCQRQMEPIIGEVVATVVPFLEDEHPRVRYAACNAIGQMSTDFAPTLQKKCHAQAVPALVKVLQATSCQRVAAHAGAALVNFSEDCPKPVISAYLPVMMKALEEVLESTFKQLVENKKKLVLEQVITTIASVADAAQDLFVEYYDRLIGPLKYILQNSGADEFKVLRGKTIECISLIGLAVGRDKFAGDANEIMGMLADTVATLNIEDPQCNYMISSWTRICKVLGPLFAPYLSMVMPAIIRAVEYAPQVAMVNDEEVDEDDPAWSFQSLGIDQNIGIRTSGMEEKATACEMLVCYARELKELFAPYVEMVVPHVMTNLKFIFHESVRSSAAEVLPCLLQCVKHQGIPAMRTLWEGFFPALIEVLSSEHDPEVLAEIINSLSECMEVLEASGMNEEEVRKIGEIIGEQLKEFDERRAQREAEEVDEDADPEEATETNAEEAELEAAVLARISDVVHSGFKVFGAAFFPVVQPFIEKFVLLTDASREYTDRQWGTCMIDDLLEFAPDQAVQYQEHLIPRLITGLGDQFPEVRQAAAYGFGAMAIKGSHVFASVCVGALPSLAAMITREDARATEEGTIATENAISSVAKILKHCGANVDQATVIPAFISWLPTYNDQEESLHIYDYFADLVEQNNVHALGANNSNLPQILRVVVAAFHNDAFEENPDHEHVKQRLGHIVRALAEDQKILTDCVNAAGLDDGEKVTLQKLMV